MTDPEILPDGTDVQELEQQIPAAYLNAPGNRGLVAAYVRGDQNLTIVRKVMGLREAHELGPDYVRGVIETYVERSFQTGQHALDFQQAVEWLRDKRCIALIGEPGTGRRTAAIALLGKLEVPLEEIPSWDPDNPGQFTVADLPAEPKTGYLFVHPDNETATPELGNELRSYEEKLSRIGSFLVFVASRTAWQAAGRTWSDTVLMVDGPDGRALLDMVVRSRRPQHDLRPLITAPQLADVAATAAPRDIVRLGDLVVATTNDPRWDLDSDRDKLIDEIIAGYQEWTDNITQWLKDNRESDKRLFLLSAAVLEGSPAGLILRYAEELGQSLLHDSPLVRPSITNPGVRELADLIDADLIGPQRRLRFRRPAYADAVLDYFLSDRSDAFREAVSEWLAKAPRTNRQGEASAVADLVAATALGVVRRRRDISFVIPIVNRWAAPRSLRPVLVSLLTAVALSNEAGAPMRSRLNRWAAKSESPPLCEVVADVCAGTLADAYPRIALTRINNLAARASGPLVNVVADAAGKLWTRPTMRRDVLHHLLAWLADRDAPAFAVGSKVLADLGSDTIQTAFTHRVDTNPALSTALANVLQTPDEPERLRDTLYGWLDIAVADESFAEWLIDVIAAAIPGPDSALRVTCVWTFANGWESSSSGSDRAVLRERLINRVCEADTTIRSWTMAIERKETQDERLV